jgi:hypothetical protein
LPVSTTELADARALAAELALGGAALVNGFCRAVFPDKELPLREKPLA